MAKSKERRKTALDKKREKKTDTPKPKAKTTPTTPKRSTSTIPTTSSFSFGSTASSGSFSFGSSSSSTSTSSTKTPFNKTHSATNEPKNWLFPSYCKTSHINKIANACYYEPGIIKPETLWQKPTVEICFSFDMTGSMSSCIDNLKAQLKQCCTTLLGDLPSIRISLIAHGDYCDTDTYVMRKLDFTNDLSCLDNFVNSLIPTYGGDAPECYEMALLEAQKLNWSHDVACSKVLVLIGDNSPHTVTASELGIDWKVELNNLNKLLGGASGDLFTCYTVQCMNNSSSTSFYQFLADNARGQRLILDNFGSMLEIFMGLCYRASADAQAAAHDEAMPEEPTTEHATTSAESSSSSTELPDEEVLKIHQAIHNSHATSVDIQGKTYQVAVGKAGCRFVHVEGITYIQQNKQSKTSYAKMAQDGKKVTWVVNAGVWGLIVDNEFVRRAKPKAASA